MADPVYDGIDAITVTFAVVLAAAVLFLLAQLVPQLADLMMPPHALGATRGRSGGQGAMSELVLREVLESRGNNFQVLEAGRIIGYIVLLTALAGTHPKPWMWSIDFAFCEGRDQTHGFEATREAAMEAFTRCWFRENKA